MGSLPLFPGLLSSGESLSPESSREQGGRAEQLPRAWREEERGRGRWGDPARGEAPLPPSFLVPAAAGATWLHEEGAGDLETVTQAELRAAQGALAPMDPAVRGRVS